MDIIEFIRSVAHESHMRGRIYKHLGEKEHPSEVYTKLNNMVKKAINMYIQQKYDDNNNDQM